MTSKRADSEARAVSDGGRMSGAESGGESPDAWGGLAPTFVRSAAADRLKALGHHDRLRIVEALAAGPKNVSEIAAAVGMPAGTVSRHLRVLHAEDDQLTGGFHAFEADNGFRWTDGNASLPTSLFERMAGPCELELHIASVARYTLTEERIRAAA